MLAICDTYLKDFNITFNASKSKIVVFGKNSCNVNVKFQGSIITQTDKEKHVGNLILALFNLHAMISMLK